MSHYCLILHKKHLCIAMFIMLLIGWASLAGCGKGGPGPEKSAETATPSPSEPASQVYEGFELTLHVFFKPLPEKMPGSEEDTPEKIALGRKLYFENGISLHKTQACNDCHRLDDYQAGVDYQATSKGAIGTFGTRNSPTVLNAGFQKEQFWDGRAADLVEQAKGPLVNPIEMAMKTPEDVVKSLKETEGYQSAFKAAFPDEAEPVTFDNVAKAIAAFERTLITPSRFDRYLKGDKTALTIEEVKGLHQFVHTGCMECHNSIGMGGRLMQKLGVYHPFSDEKDLGRYKVTHKEEDRLVFKVPMLRCVTLTPPYFHTGKVSMLPEAVRLMAWMQLNTVLNIHEINEIVHFLYALEPEHPITIDDRADEYKDRHEHGGV